MFKIPKIFISYSRHDIVAVNLLYALLESKGFECFLDKHDIGFIKYASVIENEISSCNCFLACITSESWGKDGYVKDEWDFALKIGKENKDQLAIIPLIMTEGVKSEVEGKLSIFKDYNSFYLYENDVSLFVIKLKEHFSIPIIEKTNKDEGTYTVYIKKKPYQLKISYSWYIREQVYFEDITSNRIVKLNFFNYKESMLSIGHSCLPSPIIIRMSYNTLTGSINKIQFEYEGINI